MPLHPTPFLVFMTHQPSSCFATRQATSPDSSFLGPTLYSVLSLILPYQHTQSPVPLMWEQDLILQCPTIVSHRAICF
ncbi:hypothetical protein M405DRAFT_803591 [Rhizopogon salebrosus TDB-379]|nr:hypothetical protein M405DRAFT_803591 [Rhizopogon salebrosus TDB-379]